MRESLRALTTTRRGPAGHDAVLPVLLLPLRAGGSRLGVRLRDAKRSPVAAALWLVNVLFCLAAIFVLLDAQFIGVIQVLVYAGAIMVVFLFVIIVAQPRGRADRGCPWDAVYNRGGRARARRPGIHDGASAASGADRHLPDRGPTRWPWRPVRLVAVRPSCPSLRNTCWRSR